MLRYLLILTLLTPILQTHAYADCLDTPTEVNLDSFRFREPNIYVNGSLRIFMGASEGRVVDIFTKRGEPFSGLDISREERITTDDRAWVVRKLFPRDPVAPKNYLNIALSKSGRDAIQGIDSQTIILTINSSGKSYTARFTVLPDISYACRPAPIVQPKKPSPRR